MTREVPPVTPLFQTPAKYGRFIKIMLGIAP